MKKLNIYLLGALLGCSLMATSCDDDKVSVSQVTLGVQIENPINESMKVTEGVYAFQNVNTGEVTNINYGATLQRSTGSVGTPSYAELVDGLYNVTFKGKATYTYTINERNDEGELVDVEKSETVDIQGAQVNVEVTGGNFTLNLKTYIVPQSSNNFVIAEIFPTGTLIEATNKAYNGDQYFIIHNNSDETLYADGLVLLESNFTTVQKFDYNPFVLNDAFSAQSIVMVPGSGKDYPIEAGKDMIICDNAINHKEANPASADLSKANFEWYIEPASSTATVKDTDNPDVTNLDIIYNYTKTIWILNKQGNRAYAIGRLPEGMTADKYLAENTYTYNYVMANGKTSKDFTAYKFPNEWIIDAVNLSPKNTHVWNLTSNAVDMGYTYVGENATVAENYGKAVIRKVSYTTADGRIVLQDTNNSTVDFTPATSASLLAK